MDIHAHPYVLSLLGLKKPIECTTGGISMRKSTINRIVESELDAYEDERDAGIEFVGVSDQNPGDVLGVLVGDDTPRKSQYVSAGIHDRVAVVEDYL